MRFWKKWKLQEVFVTKEMNVNFVFKAKNAFGVAKKKDVFLDKKNGEVIFMNVNFI